LGVFLWHSLSAYGAITTGYGNAGALFHLDLFGHTSLHMASWLLWLFTPIVLLFPGVVFLFKRSVAARALAALVAVYIVFYSFYEYTGKDWWFLRFLLPVAPALLVGSMMVLRELAVRAGAKRISQPVVLNSVKLICVLAIGLYSWRETRALHAMSVGRGEDSFKRASHWLMVNIPSNSAVLATELSGALYYHTPLTLVRSDQLKPEVQAHLLDALKTSHQPLFAALTVAEAEDLFSKPWPGNWRKLGEERYFGFWKYEE